MSAEIAKVLRDAADLLERDGWCQGQSVDDMGRRCVHGALHEAGDIELVAMMAMRKHLGLHYLADRNDHPDRTAAEVIRALRDCADKEDA